MSFDQEIVSVVLSSKRRRVTSQDKCYANSVSPQQTAGVWPFWIVNSTIEGRVVSGMSWKLIPVASRNLLFAILSLTFVGCGGEQRAKPVDVDLARVTLTQVLDHWKGGGAIADLRKQTPEIIVQEAFWSGGEKLQEYTVIGEPRALDGNWFCDVELTLASDNIDEPTKKTVTYAVGTDPVLTVFRAMI